jgi:hypothetical protein
MLELITHMGYPTSPYEVIDVPTRVSKNQRLMRLLPQNLDPWAAYIRVRCLENMLRDYTTNLLVTLFTSKNW